MQNNESIPQISKTTLPKLLLWRSINQGNNIAIRQKEFGIWKPLTWKEYMEEATKIASALTTLGVKPGEHVGIISENRKEWIIAQMGIGLARAVCVGIYPTSPAKEIEYIAQNSDCVTIICEDQEQADKLLMIKHSLPNVKRVVIIDIKGMKSYQDSWLINWHEFCTQGESFIFDNPKLVEENLVLQSLNDIALIVYTSGSTGKPKGAMLTWQNISFTAESAISENLFSSADSCVSYLPLCHVAEQLVSVTTGIGAGIEVNFGESLRTVQRDLQEIAPTVFLGVPRIWEKMHSSLQVKLDEAGGIRRWLFKQAISLCEPFSEKPRSSWTFKERILYLLFYIAVFRALQNHLGLRYARILISGSAPISPSLLRFFRTIGLPICEAFGMTETTALGFMQDKENLISGTVGFPYPGVEAKIADDGELLMKGPMIFAGYYKDPESTSKSLKNGWLHTGDLAEIISKQFRIVGRKKEIIITAGGKNLSPSELENNLKTSPYIKEAIVCGDRRPYLSALIQIDYENVANWAERKDIAFTNYKNLAENSEVSKLIDEHVNSANSKVANVARIKKFVILMKELDHDDDEMTATQKVRRKNILDKYDDIITSIYASN